MKLPFNQLIVLVFIFIIPFTVLGQHSNKLQWKKIETEHFKVIFPTEIEKRANYAMSLLEKSYNPISDSLVTKPKPLKLFLFNQSVTTNGYAAMAPRHMAWYTTPSQISNSIGSTDWFQTLAIHEFRHVTQFSALDTNLTTFAGSLFGDIGKAVFMNINAPFWFFEGDAVYTETELSNAGRGRLPSFYRDIYALEKSGIRYYYPKAYLGSYKDYFPNWYHLGFLMTKHVISNYGQEKWRNTIKRTTKSFGPYSFSRSLKKNTGFNTRKTYKNTLNEIDSIQNSLTTSYKKSEFASIKTKNNRHYTNYYYPTEIGQDSIIAYKKGFDNSGSLVLITNEKESKLLNINPIDRIHSNEKSVVWANEISDLRWTEHSYSDIILFDIKTKNKTRLTYHEKLFAPAVSNDNTKIAAIAYNSAMECKLIIIDIKSQIEIQQIKLPDNCFVRTPSWNNSGTQIIASSTINQNNHLILFDLEKNETKSIYDFGTRSISHPIFYNDYIIYNSYLNGKDAIFAYHLKTQKKYRIITSDYGAYNVSVNPSDQQILFQNYTINGYEIGQINTEQITWEEVNLKTVDSLLWNNKKTTNLFESFSIDSISNFKISKNYNPLLNAIKFHSWGPYPANNGIGFNITSNDELQTTNINAGLEYYPKDKAERFFSEITYSGLFPVFQLKYSNGNKYLTNASDSNNFQRINENVFSFSVHIPLNYSKYNYTTNLTFFSGYDKIFQKNYDDSFEYVAHDNALISFGLEGSKIRNNAYRDVMPKLGFEFSAINYASLISKSKLSNRFTSHLTTYIPAPLNHGFKLSMGYESNQSEFNYVYHLESDLSMIYGYEKPSFSANHFVNFLALYSLPLFYPDITLGPILYCKRIKANAFFNHGRFIENSSTLELNSYGAEVHGEFNFFNLIFPIELGVRISNRIYDNALSYEFMLMGTPF